MNTKVPLKIGWFSSGKDAQARLLLKKTYETTAQEKIGATRIDYVFCNQEQGESRETDKFIKLVHEMELPFLACSSRVFKANLRKQGLKDSKNGNFQTIETWRTMYDREISNMVEQYSAKVIFLAGYMLIVSEELCRRFTMLNLHPALPGGPKGAWQDVIWQLIENKAAESGIMMHQVTSKVDAGPVLSYCVFSLRKGRFRFLWEKMEEKRKHKTLAQIKGGKGEKEPLFQLIRAEQKKREIPLLLTTLHLLAKGEINLQNLDEPFRVSL